MSLYSPYSPTPPLCNAPKVLAQLHNVGSIALLLTINPRWGGGVAGGSPCPAAPTPGGCTPSLLINCPRAALFIAHRGMRGHSGTAHVGLLGAA